MIMDMHSYNTGSGKIPGGGGISLDQQGADLPGALRRRLGARTVFDRHGLGMRLQEGNSGQNPTGPDGFPSRPRAFRRNGPAHGAVARSFARTSMLLSMAVAAALGNTPSVMAGPAARVTRKMIEETVERAARRSGRKAVVGKASGKAARRTLEKLVKTYGDDVLKVVDDAGLELLEAVPRYGNELVEVAIKASPGGRRALAANIPELLPLARRAGAEALELEAKSPGLSVWAFRLLGDDAGRAVARNVPAEDLPRLLKYAEKADSPATRKMLLEAYEKEGRRLFRRIPAKWVLASGLTAAMLYGTHSQTAPQRAIGRRIASDPDLAREVAAQTIAVVGVLVAGLAVLLLWRFGLLPWHRKRGSVSQQQSLQNSQTESSKE